MNNATCNHKTHQQNAQLQCIKGTGTYMYYMVCNFTNSTNFWKACYYKSETQS